MSSWMPCLVHPAHAAPSLGHPVLDDYLRFVKARVRANSLLAVAFDLKVFFEVTGREPVDVTTRDVLAFIEAQRQPRRGGNVVRIDDGEQGLSARTVKRRLSSVSGLFAFLVARGDVESNPVPRGLATRRIGRRGVPLIRAPHTLPRVLEPEEATALLGALRTQRDRAMVEAMLFGALRRCEVLGLRLEDLRLGEHRVFVADGKGGHQRLVPIAPKFFMTVAAYLADERPMTSTTDRLFVVLKGQRRGLPLSASGLDEILSGARTRAGLQHATCHELRHTCLTRLREAGMALEAVQAQAGHRSIESTRIYLHLSNSWLAEEYRRAMSVLDALPGNGEQP
ncbi:MAG: tyrosine-type recombinase/integrase [Sporichthyaceae bacterium]|nr:tyrosine-type recombinase/integrase [Sporichthyaceae bacterium]